MTRRAWAWARRAAGIAAAAALAGCTDSSTGSVEHVGPGLNFDLTTARSRGLPGGTWTVLRRSGTPAQPDSIRVSVGPLEPLKEGAAYKLLLINRTTGASQAVNARYWTVTVDTTSFDAAGTPVTRTTTSAASTVNQLIGGAPNVTHVLELTNTMNAGVSLGAFDALGLQPTSATNAVPIWASYRSGASAGALTFGTLPLTANAVPYTFQVVGSASGTNRGREGIGIRFTHLRRPPVGYVYTVWLVSTDTKLDPISLGELRTPLPELASLADADVAANGGVLTSSEILAANILVRAADVPALGADLSKYSITRLTLEAKDGRPAMSPAVVLEGPFFTP